MAKAKARELTEEETASLHQSLCMRAAFDDKFFSRAVDAYISSISAQQRMEMLYGAKWKEKL